MRIPSVASCNEAYISQKCPLREELIQKYREILEWYDKTVTRSERIWHLSQPKNYYCDKPKTPASKRLNSAQNVDIELLNHDEIRTRLEQLALPKASTLQNLQETPSFNKYPIERKNSVNRLLRRSLLSIYSALANVKPSEKPKVENLTAELKKEQKKAMKRLARPINRQKPKPPPKPKITIMADYKKEFNRTPMLAEPRRRDPEEKPQKWELTPGLKNYVPSERIKLLAKPVQRVEPEITNTKLVKELDLNRLNVLAMPRKVTPKKMNLIRVKSVSKAPSVSSAALKAKASKRIKQLAQPRSKPESHKKIDPFRVRSRALWAKSSKRLNQLAEPKSY